MFSKKNIYIALIFIVLLGAFLRFYKLGNNSFVSDEFLDINSSYAYFKTGIWQNWDFNFGRVNEENVYQARDERAWIYKWQVAEIFKFLPPTEGVARTVSVLWGILSIIIIYFTGSYFTKKKTIGLISAFLFAVSISGIEMDRRLRMYAMFLPVYLLFSLIFYRFLEEKYDGKIAWLKKLNKKWDLNLLFLIPALILGIVSFLTHQLTVNFVAFLAIYLVFWSLIGYRKNKFRSKYFFLICLGILGLIAMFAIDPKQIRNNFGGLRFFNNHWEYFMIAFSDYSSGILAFIFLILGGYFIYKKLGRTKEASWLLFSFFIPLFMAVFLWSRNVGNQYIFFIRSFEIILVASGIYFAADYFRENLSKNGTKAYLATLILSLLILPNYSYFLQENNTYRQNSNSSNPNYRKIFTYFKKYKNENDVLISRNFRNYYWSGAKIKVFDFGGELAKEKLSLNQIQGIVKDNPSGWIIISKNDENYIANDAIDYMVKNFQRVSNPQVRGDVMVYRWGI